MNRLVPIYLLLLTAANAIMGWSGIWLAHHLRTAYAGLLRDDDLPTITLRALHLPTAFYFLAVVGVGLTLITWRPRLGLTRWAHAGVAVVVLDLVLLVYLLLGFVMPFFTLTIKL